MRETDLNFGEGEVVDELADVLAGTFQSRDGVVMPDYGLKDM